MLKPDIRYYRHPHGEQPYQSSSEYRADLRWHQCRPGCGKQQKPSMTATRVSTKRHSSNRTEGLGAGSQVARETNHFVADMLNLPFLHVLPYNERPGNPRCAHA